MKTRNTDFIEMPQHIDIHNGTHERCDMLIGCCSCGAWHKIDDWNEKIANAAQYTVVKK